MAGKAELKSLVSFKGPVLVAFDIEINGKTATFAENPKSTMNRADKKARFVRNIKEQKGSGIFTADIVTPVEVAQLAKLLSPKKLLFCVHGWNGTPGVWISTCKTAQRRFNKKDANYQLVPVLWPANENFIETLPLDKRDDMTIEFTADYLESRKDASEAAKMLANTLADIDSRVRMDIVGVGMGAHLTKELARFRKVNYNQKTFSFDNIFLSAADIRGDIFKHDEGDLIVDMLRHSNKGGGKVHVFHNKNDVILKLATKTFPDKKGDGKGWCFDTIVLWLSPKIERLGYNEGSKKYGSGSSGRVVNVSVSMKGNPLQQHGYLFDDERIEYYKQTTRKYVSGSMSSSGKNVSVSVTGNTLKQAHGNLFEAERIEYYKQTL